MKHAGLVLALIAIVAAFPLAGCQTTRTLPDGTVIRETDMAATAAAIQLAMTALEQGAATWERIHPQATAEERAAEQARRDAKQQQLQALLERLLAGAITPREASVAKAIVVTH